jgi:hypothetical protein
MRIIGIITTIVVAAVVVGGVVVLVASIPDIRRYKEIRDM